MGTEASLLQHNLVACVLTWKPGKPCTGPKGGVYYLTAGAWTLNKWPEHPKPYGLFRGNERIGYYATKEEAFEVANEMERRAT